MPKGTRVHRCVDKLKKKGYTGSAPYRICQKSTKQSYKTGKKLEENSLEKGSTMDPYVARIISMLNEDNNLLNTGAITPDFDTANDDNEDKFSENDLKIAKRFIEDVGSAERAKNLIDKVNDCQECLGLVDDDDVSDEASIEIISQAVPNSPDLPRVL